MKPIIQNFLFSGHQFDHNESDKRYKFVFLNNVTGFAVLAAIIIGIIRMYKDFVLMGCIDIAFAMLFIVFLYQLRRSKENLESISTSIIISGYLFFAAIFIFSPNQSNRLSLFFLLIASVFFLKGKKSGLRWLIGVIITINLIHFSKIIDTHHATLDILAVTAYLIALYFVLNMYEAIKDAQTQTLQYLNRNLESIVKQRTGELESANLQLNITKSEIESLNKKLEEKLEISLQEINRQQALLIQQTKLAAMGEMIGNIAHQWRQPLNALALAVQDIEMSYTYNELTDESVKEFATISMDQINYMSKTIDDFRDFVKPGKKVQVFDVSETIAEATSLLQATMANSHTVCTIHNPAPVAVIGSMSEFKQVIMNLISNSIDAIKENKITDPKIDINIVPNQESVTIYVQDNGGGIPQDILDRVFEPYFTTKEEGKGTGVGLYMSHAIICKKLNGTMTVENRNGGAVFTMQIPTAPKETV